MTIPFSSAWVAFGHHEHHFPFLRDHLGIILVDFGYPGEPLGTMGIILCALGTLWASFCFFFEVVFLMVFQFVFLIDFGSKMLPKSTQNRSKIDARTHFDLDIVF